MGFEAEGVHESDEFWVHWVWIRFGLCLSGTCISRSNGIAMGEVLSLYRGEVVGCYNLE